METVLEKRSTGDPVLFNVKSDFADFKAGDSLICENVPRSEWNGEGLKYEDHDFVITLTGHLKMDDVEINIPDRVNFAEIHGIDEEKIDCTLWDEMYTVGYDKKGVYMQYIVSIHRVIEYQYDMRNRRGSRNR